MIVNPAGYTNISSWNLRLRLHNWLIRAIVGRRRVVMNVRLERHDGHSFEVRKVDGLLMVDCFLGAGVRVSAAAPPPANREGE